MGKRKFELDVVSVRLVKDASIMSDKKITSLFDSIELMSEYVYEMDRECVFALFLKTDGTPICCHPVSIGNLDSSIVSPREIFKVGVLCNAASFILMHNHPSGSLIPSACDARVTDKLIVLGHLFDMPLLDHIIVGGDNSTFFSFKEKGMLSEHDYRLCTDYNELDFTSRLVAEA